MLSRSDGEKKKWERVERRKGRNVDEEVDASFFL